MMEPVVTAAAMRAVEEEAGRRLGLDPEVLMEDAAQALCRAAEAEVEQGAPIGLLVGGGNNGGDVLAAGRLLLAKGHPVTVLATTDAASLHGPAAANAARLERLMGEAIAPARTFPAASFGLLIDGLLGTGAKGAPRGLVRDLIAWANDSGVPILSADLPSGVGADDGSAPGEAICASVTVTFGFKKPCAFLEPGRSLGGRWTLDPIGLPRQMAPPGLAAAERGIGAHLPRWKGTDHKGTRGRLAVVAGSSSMAGAAGLCALGALRGGAGLVTVAAPAGVARRLFSQAPEAMTLELSGEDHLEASDLGAILELAERVDAVAIGPGLGRGEATRQVVAGLVTRYEGRLLLDADALNALDPAVIAEIPKRVGGTLLTPHPGELLRHQPGTGAVYDWARGAAAHFGAPLVLKGAPSVMAHPDGRVVFNTTGCDLLAQGGSGDVLTGLVAALWVQGSDGWDALLSGVYVHGLAADLLRAEGIRVGAGALALAQMLPRALGRC